jgi:hypothetical protein
LKTKPGRRHYLVSFRGRKETDLIMTEFLNESFKFKFELKLITDKCPQALSLKIKLDPNFSAEKPQPLLSPISRFVTTFFSTTPAGAKYANRRGKGVIF